MEVSACSTAFVDDMRTTAFEHYLLFILKFFLKK